MRTNRPSRKATEKVNYTTTTELDLSGSEEEESEESEQERKGKGKKKGGSKVKGKGKKKSKDERDEEDTSEQEDAHSEKKKKTGKKAKGKGKAKEGKNPLDSLPVELFNEILSHVSPYDLVHLSRTSKSYRSVLLSKRRSNATWVAARRSVGLPDLTADDMSEPAYAELVFGTRCDICGRMAKAWLDAYLRRRLCQHCRKDVLVKVSNDTMDKMVLHPASLFCVPLTPYTPNDCRYETNDRFAFAHDVQYIDKAIKTLNEDDGYDIFAGNVESTDINRETSSVCRMTLYRRRRMLETKSGKKVKEDEEDYWTDVRRGPRVQKFVTEAKEHVAKVYADGKAIHQVSRRVLSKVSDLERQAQESVRFEKYESNYSARASLEARIATVPGYTKDDIRSIGSRSISSLVPPGQPLTDELWKNIKAKTLALIDRNKANTEKKLEKSASLDRQVARKNSLRQRYDSLKDSAAVGSFFPVFDDFLALDTVKELWLRSDEDKTEKVSKEDWDDQVAAIKEDLEQYQADLVDYAVRNILSNTRDYKSEQDFEDAVEATLAGDLDNFFKLASSMLNCSLGCQGTSVKVVTRSFWGYRTKYKKQAAFRGSLSDVVAHSHQAHGTSTTSAKSGQVLRYPVALPAEVACVVSAVIEVGNLKIDSATVNDLDRLDSGWFRWDNSKYGGKKNYHTWASLVDAVDLTTYKLSKKRPPVDLESPLIIYHPSHQGLLPLKVESDVKGKSKKIDTHDDDDDPSTSAKIFDSDHGPSSEEESDGYSSPTSSRQTKKSRAIDMFEEDREDSPFDFGE